MIASIRSFFASFFVGLNGRRSPAVQSYPAAPTIVTAAIALGTPAVINLTFSTAIIAAGADYLTGWSCKVAGSARTINSAALQTAKHQLNLTLASNVTTGQSVTLSYTIASGLIYEAQSLTRLAAMTDAVVTNNT